MGLPESTGYPSSEKYHFHPGTDGEAGTGGVDGDQKIDQWFPAGIQGFAFSRTAYVAIRSEEDIEAPTNECLVLGKYKTRKVGTYDASGALLSTAYSANPVWQILDILLMREPVSRIAFATFAAKAAYCAEQITVNGKTVTRFESHVAFPKQVSFGDALQALLNTCRGYLYDDAGKISIRVDQARNAVHTFTDKIPSNIVNGSFRYWTRDISAATNRLRLKFRDLGNDFAFSDVVVEREWAQELTGKVVERELNLANMLWPECLHTKECRRARYSSAARWKSDARRCFRSTSTQRSSGESRKYPTPGIR